MILQISVSERSSNCRSTQKYATRDSERVTTLPPIKLGRSAQEPFEVTALCLLTFPQFHPRVSHEAIRSTHHRFALPSSFSVFSTKPDSARISLSLRDKTKIHRGSGQSICGDENQFDRHHAIDFSLRLNLTQKILSADGRSHEYSRSLYSRTF